MSFQPKFMCTGIGSMPFSDPDYAAKLSLEKMPDAPMWPQLPFFGLNEQMEIQYSEGIPRGVIEADKNRMYFDTTGDYSEEFGEFYEQYMTAMDPDEGDGDCSCVAISSDFSKGISALENALITDGTKRPFVKVHVVGPVTMALTLVDENKRAVFYNEEFRDVITKTLAMKARWQIQKFSKYAENVICFIDEPILSAFGSSTYVSVNRDDVIALLAEMYEAIQMEGALAGIHCCGNTEWSIPIEAGLDIINFDAFEYGHTIAMYPEAVKELLERGGALAWGIVPTSDVIRSHNVESLEEILEQRMDQLAAKGIDKELIMNQAILSPSCGTGSMSNEDAEDVFGKLWALSVRMKEKYGF